MTSLCDKVRSSPASADAEVHVGVENRSDLIVNSHTWKQSFSAVPNSFDMKTLDSAMPPLIERDFPGSETTTSDFLASRPSSVASISSASVDNRSENSMPADAYAQDKTVMTSFDSVNKDGFYGNCSSGRDLTGSRNLHVDQLAHPHSLQSKLSFDPLSRYYSTTGASSSQPNPGVSFFNSYDTPLDRDQAMRANATPAFNAYTQPGASNNTFDSNPHSSTFNALPKQNNDVTVLPPRQSLPTTSGDLSDQSAHAQPYFDTDLSLDAFTFDPQALPSDNPLLGGALGGSGASQAYATSNEIVDEIFGGQFSVKDDNFFGNFADMDGSGIL